MSDEILDKDVYIQMLEQQVLELQKSQKAIYERNDNLLAWQWVIEHHREHQHFGGLKFTIDFVFSLKNQWNMSMVNAYHIVESALSAIKKADTDGGL